MRAIPAMCAACGADGLRFVATALAVVLIACAEASSDSANDIGDSADSAQPEPVPGWAGSPFTGEPRTCEWGAFGWSGTPDLLVKLELPYGRNEGAAGVSFAAEGAIPEELGLYIVENSSAYEEGALDELCTFDEDREFSVPGTWWVGASGNVSVQAEHLRSGEEVGMECGRDETYRLDVQFSGGTVVSGATQVDIPPAEWSGIEETMPACPPE